MGREGLRIMPWCLHREAGGWRPPPCNGELEESSWGKCWVHWGQVQPLGPEEMTGWRQEVGASSALWGRRSHRGGRERRGPRADPFKRQVGPIGKAYEKGSEMWEETQARVRGGPRGMANVRPRKRDSNASVSAGTAIRWSVVTLVKRM